MRRGLSRIDPQIVIVTMGCGQFAEGASAIDRFPGLDVEDVDSLGILRVGNNVQKYQGRRRKRRSSFKRSHVAPPLSERNRPPSSASTMAQTRSDRAGETATPILPSSPAGSGWRESSVQVSPPSVDVYRLLSGPPLLRLQGVRCTSQMVA